MSETFSIVSCSRRIQNCSFSIENYGDESIANDSGSSVVLFRSITSGDEFRKSGYRSITSGDRSRKSDSGVSFVREESSASGARFLIVFSRSFASFSRSFVSGARFGDDDRRRVARGRGVPAGGGVFTPCGAGLSIAPSYPYMVTCPYCPLCTWVEMPSAAPRAAAKST